MSCTDRASSKSERSCHKSWNYFKWQGLCPFYHLLKTSFQQQSSWPSHLPFQNSDCALWGCCLWVCHPSWTLDCGPYSNLASSSSALPAYLLSIQAHWWLDRTNSNSCQWLSCSWWSCSPWALWHSPAQCHLWSGWGFDSAGWPWISGQASHCGHWSLSEQASSTSAWMSSPERLGPSGAEGSSVPAVVVCHPSCCLWCEQMK